MSWKRVFKSILAVGLYFGATLAAGQRAPPVDTILVGFSDEVGLSDSELRGFRDEATRLLKTAGIRALWVHCRVGDGLMTLAACWGLVSDNGFLVRVVPEASQRRYAALGTSFVSKKGAGDYATLHFARIKIVADECRRKTGSVMALVLVHEIGHLLGGPAHYPFGVMQTNWTCRQIIGLLGRGPLFAGSQSMQLRDNLARRGGLTMAVVK